MASDVILFYFLVPLVQKSESQIREGFRQNRRQGLLSLFCIFAPSFPFSSSLSLFIPFIWAIPPFSRSHHNHNNNHRHELCVNRPRINKNKILRFQVLSPSGIRIFTSLLQGTAPPPPSFYSTIWISHRRFQFLCV